MTKNFNLAEHGRPVKVLVAAGLVPHQCIMVWLAPLLTGFLYGSFWILDVVHYSTHCGGRTWQGAAQQCNKQLCCHTLPESQAHVHVRQILG